MTKRLPTRQRQRQIAGAALELISRQGVTGFTTAALSEKVELAEGTIFRHFASKQAIALAAIDLLIEQLEESFPDDKDDNEVDSLERLGLFMRHRLQLVLTHRGVFRAFFSGQLAMAAGEEGVQKMEQIKRDSLDFLRQCLTEAAGDGQIRGGVSPGFLLQVIEGTVHAFLFGVSPETDADADPEKLAGRTWSSLIKLIRG